MDLESTHAKRVQSSRSLDLSKYGQKHCPKLIMYLRGFRDMHIAKHNWGEENMMRALIMRPLRSNVVK